MKLMKPIGMIDLHCDTLIKNPTPKEGLGYNGAHLSLTKMPVGTRWAQFFAIFIRDHLRGPEAEAWFDNYADYFDAEMQRYSHLVRPCRSFADIEAAFEEGKFAAVLTVEGGAALGGRFEQLAHLYDRGVRSMTLTWNGPNELCSGHNTDEGLSDLGRRVITEMERIGMIIDTSHLNDRGFDELCELAERPFIASHSNLRSICNHKRNLTEEHFKEFVRRGGLVGLNYYKPFVVEDSNFNTFEDLFRHVYRMLELGGEKVICLGSDYDGADIPPILDSVEKSLLIKENFVKLGLSEEVADDIMFGNAYNFFSRHLK